MRSTFYGVTFRLRFFATLLLAVFFGAVPALSKGPDPDNSFVGAVHDSLCMGNASAPLVVEVLLHDVFDSPVSNWHAADIAVRRADGLGPSIPADNNTNTQGYTTITTTVGAVVGSGCADALEVVVSGYFVMTVRRVSAPIATIPDCVWSSFSVQHPDICPRFASDEVVVHVTLLSPFHLPIAAVAAESVTVRCATAPPGADIAADAPTDANGHTTITVTVDDLVDTACCDTVVIVAHQGFSSCEKHLLVSFGPYDGPYPVAEAPNPEPEAEDRFGECAAAFQGDFLIGAPLDGVGGSVTRVDGETGELVFMIPTPPGAGHRFGVPVVDAGGRIAATDASAGGRVYVYDDQGHPLFEIANPELDATDNFGTSLAYLSGTLFVGASADSVNGLYAAGTVYAFDMQTGNFRFEIPNPAPASFDAFGVSLAVRGNDLIVGASQDNSFDGSIYVFAADGTQELHVAGPAGLHAAFGARVAAFGNDLVAACASGLVLVLDGTSGDVLRTITLPENLSFGTVVTTSRYIVGSLPREDNVLAPDAGYAYVHDGFTGELVARIRDPLPAWSDYFGWGMAATETALLICAPGHAARSGTAFLYSNGPTAAPVVVSASPGRLQAWPNPFRTTTRITFWLSPEEHASLSIYDAAGRIVRRLGAGPLAAGRQVVEWDGSDANGTSVAAGIYFVRLASPGNVRTGRVVRLR